MFSLTPENSANDHLSFFIHRTIRQKFDCVIDDAQAMALRSFSFFFLCTFVVPFPTASCALPGVVSEPCPSISAEIVSVPP